MILIVYIQIRRAPFCLFSVGVNSTKTVKNAILHIIEYERTVCFVSTPFFNGVSDLRIGAIPVIPKSDDYESVKNNYPEV